MATQKGRISFKAGVNPAMKNGGHCPIGEEGARPPFLPEVGRHPGPGDGERCHIYSKKSRAAHLVRELAEKSPTRLGTGYMAATGSLTFNAD